MGFTFRSISHIADGSQTCDKPAGTVSGDFLIAAMFIINDTALTPPTGWSEVFTETLGAITYKVFSKVSGGSEPDTYTWTGYTGDYIQIAIAAYSGATSPTFDVSAALANSIEDNAIIVANTVTTTQDNDLVVYFGNKDATNTWTGSGGTERLDEDSTFWYDEIKTPAGLTTARTFTASVSSTSARQVVTIAFKETLIPFNRSRQMGPILAQ